MSAFTLRWCKEHGDWDDDVDNPAEGCPMCIESGAFKTRAQLERELNEARAKLAALQATPDVAGLVNSIRALRSARHEWENAPSSELLTLDAAIDALLSLSAQLQEKEELAQCYKEDYEDSRKALTSLAKKFAEKEAEVDRLNVLLSAVGFLSKEDGSK